MNYPTPIEGYFDPIIGKGGAVTGWTFAPVRLARDIQTVFGVCRGPGGALWHNDDGVYRPGGKEIVEECVQHILGEEFKRNRIAEVMAWMNALPIEVSTEPPPEHFLPVANGVLDLDTLELRPYGADERWTYRIPHRWNPDAGCLAIRAFMQEVLPADALHLASEMLGLCLMPTGRFRRAIMLVGTGSNGKSVFLSLARALVGAANVSAIPLHAISDDRFARAELFGKLANVCGDLDARPLERTDYFKMLTGADEITADRKFGQPFKFTSFATLVFSANEWPVARDQSDAYFQRWLALRFDGKFREDGGELQPGERRADPRIIERLTTREELEGLLVAAVRGARRLRERGGFDVPASVRNAVDEYRGWADTILAWFDEAATPDGSGLLTRKAVFKAYQDWCRENGRSAVSSRRFWPRFREVASIRGADISETKTPDAASVRAVRGLRIEGASAWV